MTASTPAADRAAIAANVAHFRRAQLPGAGLKPASVALCVVLRDEVPCLLITRRAPNLRSHAGQWALPGGRREAGEQAEDAARRELLEETGIAVATVGEPVASREFVMQMPDGENVIADERLFVVHVSDSRLSRAGWTALEKKVMAEHRWWSADELRNTSDTVWPSNLPEILAEAGSRSS